MAIDESIVQTRLVMLFDSKSQNDKKINQLNDEAKILRKRLQIETN